jgi:hypothetical protein
LILTAFPKGAPRYVIPLSQKFAESARDAWSWRADVGRIVDVEPTFRKRWTSHHPELLGNNHLDAGAFRIGRLSLGVHADRNPAHSSQLIFLKYPAQFLELLLRHGGHAFEVEDLWSDCETASPLLIQPVGDGTFSHNSV